MTTQNTDTLCTCIYSPGDAKTKHKSLNSEFVLYQTWINRIIKEGAVEKVAEDGLYKFFKPEDKNDKKALKEFDKTYKPNDAINWYTRETCIYRMMNKALRTHDMKTINAFGDFIRDLFKQLGEEHVPYVKQQRGPKIRVYRGQLISKEELNRLKFNKNQCISINSFLSTSTNRAKAIEFATSRPPPSDTLTTVLLEIETDSRVSARPFSDIKHLSAIPSEEEILFGVGSIFRIDEIYEDKEVKLWRANFTVILDVDSVINEFPRASVGLDGTEQFIIDFGLNLIDMNEYQDAEKYFDQTLEKNHSENVLYLAYIHYGLALSQNNNGKSDLALQNLDRIMDIIRGNNKTKDHQLMGQCYNERGSIYCEQANFFEAMASYDQALGCAKNEESTTYAGLADVHYRLKNYRLAMEYQTKAIEKQPASDKALIANNYLLIAKIYAALGDGDKSLNAINKALVLQKECLPEDHADMGYTYSARAAIISQLFPHMDASEDYEKAVQIQQKSLLSTHPDFGDSYKNLGTFHAGKSNFDKSLSYFHKLLDNQLVRYSSNHPAVGGTFETLADTYWKMKNLDKAIEFYHKLLENQLSRLPAGSQEFNKTYENLSKLYEEKRQYTESLKFYRKLLGNHLVKKRKDDPMLTPIYLKISELTQKANELAEGLLYQHNALDSERRKVPRDMAAIDKIYETIGKIYLKKSSIEQTLQTYESNGYIAPEQVTEEQIFDLYTERRHLDLDLSYFIQKMKETGHEKFKIIANIYIEKRDYYNAYIYMEKLLKKQLLERSHLDPIVAETQAYLGDISLKLRNLHKAIHHFQHSLTAYETNYPANAPSIQRIRRILQQLYSH